MILRYQKTCQRFDTETLSCKVYALQDNVSLSLAILHVQSFHCVHFTSLCKQLITVLNFDDASELETLSCRREIARWFVLFGNALKQKATPNLAIFCSSLFTYFIIMPQAYNIYTHVHEVKYNVLHWLFLVCACIQYICVFKYMFVFSIFVFFVYLSVFYTLGQC